jgi:hypothetical protein
MVRDVGIDKIGLVKGGGDGEFGARLIENDDITGGNGDLLYGNHAFGA